MKPVSLRLFAEHGIIKERISALATDAIRAEMLEYAGYKTDIIEFTDSEHTAKNLLIRARRRRGKRLEKTVTEAAKLMREFSFKPLIVSLLLIERLERGGHLTKEEFLILLEGREAVDGFAAEKAREITEARFGKGIFVRGLVEFTNHCRNNCLYCGIRAENSACERYRLSADEILECCGEGYALGLRTFVLQGGEDPFYTDDKICGIVRSVKRRFPDCAVTLSIGERPRESYQSFFDAGADRFLLRHETADSEHYAKLHPPQMTFESRRDCLINLKEIGFQTGAGFMVGPPFQELRHIAEDLIFLQELKPQMVGIGPFIPHAETPFHSEPAGDIGLSLFLISLVRIMLPNALIPATTAIGTAKKGGRIEAVLRGANVLMTNISPPSLRGKYALYDGKQSAGEHSAEHEALKKRFEKMGFEFVVGRGDFTDE
jgi:biotin synthase